MPSTSLRSASSPPARLALALLLALAAVPALAAGARAQVVNEALVCPEPGVELDRYQYLRALSLDLRGRLPSDAEYAALDALDGVPVATIDAWLASDEFAERVVRLHHDLLWNNVSNQRLLNNNMNLTRDDATGLYYRRNLALGFRGDRVPCADEPASYDDAGLPVTREVGGLRLEGYELVSPYWAPETTVKVCAYDAQSALTSPTGTDCTHLADGAHADPACGCGPELSWCVYPRGERAGEDEVLAALAEDVDRRVRANIVNDEPYVELLTSRRAFVNGPLVHFWRHWTGHYRNLLAEPTPLPVDRLPDLAWTDHDEWVEIELPPQHAGVLTSPAFLIRFQTNRARANRFYNAFLCQAFVAPRGGLPAEVEGVRPHPDLQERDGCDYCHASLEPAAAYWGRWLESGFGYLDAERFPATREDCELCALTTSSCSSECSRFYHVRSADPEEDAFLGALRPYLFLREAHRDHVELGPAGLVTSQVVDGRLVECSTRTAAEWLFGRPLDRSEGAWMTALMADFAASDFSYRELVRAIVTSPAYRRVR